MKPLKAREIVRILEKDGWYLIKTKGSHRHFKHPIKQGKVTVPYHTGGEDIKLKTLISIFKQAEISQAET